MSKTTHEIIMDRIVETEEILLKELNLKTNLNVEELCSFYEKFIPYLMHNRNNEMLGRTPETLKINIDKYVEFCKKIGLDEKEIIESIGNFPSIIHTFGDEFMDKYVLLSVIENEDNTFRKSKLVKNPRNFSSDINTIYARYMLMNKFNYPITWSNLVKATNNEFASIFVKNEYYKPYKKFESIDEVNLYLGSFSVDYNFINELKKLDINSFCGVSYGKK